jgi:hypothetical protein
MRLAAKLGYSYKLNYVLLYQLMDYRYIFFGYVVVDIVTLLTT